MWPRVIVGVGGKGAHPRVLRTAVSLAWGTGAVLYAVDVRNGCARAVRPTATSRSGPPAMQPAYRALAQAGGLAEDLDARIVVTAGEPGETLLLLANRPDDLLVLGHSRRHRGTGRGARIALRCATYARCSVVLVPYEHPAATDRGVPRSCSARRGGHWSPPTRAPSAGSEPHPTAPTASRPTTAPASGSGPGPTGPVSAAWPRPDMAASAATPPVPPPIDRPSARYPEESLSSTLRNVDNERGRGNQ